MKRLALVLTLLCLLALGGQAFAELCTIDAVPAATLAVLVPFRTGERYGPVVVDGALLVGAAIAIAWMSHA